MLRKSIYAIGMILLVSPLLAAGDAAVPDLLAAGDAPLPGAVEPAPLPGVHADPPGGIEEEVEDALGALASRVRPMSDPDALRMAFRAYFAYRAAHPERVRKPYLYFVDYGLGNRAPRGWVFDMDQRTVVEGPFTVAHGRGSSRSRNGAPTSFSNRPGSNATSLGLYLTQETYGFRGKANGRRYRSIGLRMAGLSGGFNDAARRRGVVAHGAPYVSARDAGRSEGCPALEERRAQRLLPMLAEGSLVFLYSPNDPVWLAGDPWASSAAGARPRAAASSRDR